MVHTDVVMENVVSHEGGQDLDTAWMCALQGVPALVGALDAASVCSDVLARSRKATLSNVFNLFTVHLGQRGDNSQIC